MNTIILIKNTKNNHFLSGKTITMKGDCLALLAMPLSLSVYQGLQGLIFGFEENQPLQPLNILQTPVHCE